jgi:predicted transposase YbfD/YdcC
VLAQKAVDEKTNEITVLPDLLGLPEIEGGLVTIDAMGTPTDIAEAIVGRGGCRQGRPLRHFGRD